MLDYFHVAMKVRHADQCIGKIPPYAFSPNGSVFELYDRFNHLRGYLWSGRRDKFKECFDRLLYLLDRGAIRATGVNASGEYGQRPPLRS